MTGIVAPELVAFPRPVIADNPYQLILLKSYTYTKLLYPILPAGRYPPMVARVAVVELVASPQPIAGMPIPGMASAIYLAVLKSAQNNAVSPKPWPRLFGKGMVSISPLPSRPPGYVPLHPVPTANPSCVARFTDRSPGMPPYFS